ncbi:peptide ABC transporter substrate-binding protein [Facklamia sp. DSM 111018]|uniref:Peptide ABC transporter substrate-binding protein n=1 Tax=Facklamia lactis TaxID=2749967 RepID=A0ABS0LU09_9LACT|nr:peptide ABC transporter substrate-binding protein [Facklamia lactis]MBG9981154.1 peptide ABC transporter substrate-binding protein [Facklamia lactis]MBG9986955.1 peptide ABC transporter substrate-binding protein [Facklamia lactis]
MKKQIKKAIVSIMAAFTLGSLAAPMTSFAQEEGELVPEYKATYLTDPTSLDYTFSMRDINTNHTVNFIDGLYENDQYGNYIPAVAESHEVSEDGLTYTYKIRPGVMWYDMNGNEWAETTAHDFVTGLQHAVEVQSEMLPIVQNSIKGLNEYINGEITDFAEVGVKAVDDYTLEYTLTKPEPYFNSKTTYGILYPINQEFLDSMGADFGSLSPDSILYNGPFLLTNLTAKSQIEYVKNENYWDAGNVFVDTVSFTYNDGSDPEVFYRLYKDGAVSFFTVQPNLPIYKEVKAEFENEITQQRRQGSAFLLQFNMNRIKHEATGKSDDSQHEDTHSAILNKKFRQAIMFGFDRHTYMTQLFGEEFADTDIRNTLVAPEYVNVGEENFGDATLRHLQEMDPELYGDVNLEDGQDGFYNPEKAKKLIEEAKAELEVDGVTFPIQIDIPVLETVPLAVNQAKSLKATIEESLGSDNVVINPVLLAQDPYLAATFNATVAAEVDYDFTNESGWIPDYLDPSTFLDIYHPKNGTFLVPIGFDPILQEGAEDPYAEARKESGLEEYGTLVDEANAITDDMDARYDAHAKAQAWLTDSAIAIPIRTGGSLLRVTNVVPFSGPYAFAGTGGQRFKFMKVQAEPVSKEQWQKAYDEWEAKKIDASSISGEKEEAGDESDSKEETQEESKEESEETKEESEESKEEETSEESAE